MEDMYNMGRSMQIHPFYPMMSCPMMIMQPMNINQMMMCQMPNHMNHNLSNNICGTTPMGCQNACICGGGPMRSNINTPYLFQVEMRHVSMEEIED